MVYNTDWDDTVTDLAEDLETLDEVVNVAAGPVMLREDETSYDELSRKSQQFYTLWSITEHERV